jgi:hypothetical protein
MSTVHDMNNTLDNLNGGNENKNTRETPRKGGNVDDHMDDHGEQPGPTPGRGAGRSENLQGGSMWMITWMAMVSSRDRTREGARGAQRTYRGGVQRRARSIQG